MAGAACKAKGTNNGTQSVLAHVLILLCFWDTIVAPLPILEPDDDDEDHNDSENSDYNAATSSSSSSSSSSAVMQVMYLESPQQSDKCNCGVYCLAFLEQKVRGLTKHPMQLLEWWVCLCLFVCMRICVYVCVCMWVCVCGCALVRLCVIV